MSDRHPSSHAVLRKCYHCDCAWKQGDFGTAATSVPDMCRGSLVQKRSMESTTVSSLCVPGGWQTAIWGLTPDARAGSSLRAHRDPTAYP